MNYLMLQRELKTLSEDLMQIAEHVIGPEPAERKPDQPPVGRMAMRKEEIKREIDYVSEKLEAVSLFVAGE